VAAAGKKKKQAVVDKMLTPCPTKSAESSVKFFKVQDQNQIARCICAVQPSQKISRNMDHSFSTAILPVPALGPAGIWGGRVSGESEQQRLGHSACQAGSHSQGLALPDPGNLTWSHRLRCVAAFSVYLRHRIDH
jgi:hypothetical protein